ncbi:MAG: DUF3683 domain-containing protein [Desulfobacteraceae bacterium]|nr:DUF3683 domain-containing protein [Desulfobacteraceae bacterium]
MRDPKRKIPYNYTSANDDQIIRHLFGSGIQDAIAHLDSQKNTGRSSRLLHRFMGDLFIIQRNPFLFQELLEHPVQRRHLFSECENDLDIIEKAARHPAVFQVLSACRNALKALSRQILTHFTVRQKILGSLAPVIGRDNIYFDPFTIMAHATDATDWRRFLPIAVLRPDKETQVPQLVTRIRDLGLHIIPRGAGTGLTGGATPLTAHCVMVNTEKLNRISDIAPVKTPGPQTHFSIHLEAGVITQDAKDAAAKNKLIFATDPTSAWACTIGGNLSENAGGKTAVLFGTALDNVLSYNIVMADGHLYTVTRKHHPGRKILSTDRVTFEVTDDQGQKVQTIALAGEQIRKKNLGKDVTNKTLNGLPGIQKEGCDGIITSARFILYPAFAHKKTSCIEFFGNDMTEAGQVIAAISRTFSGKDPAIMALEHFDEEYIKAIRYKTKQAMGTRLKAVLLVDMVSNDNDTLDQGLKTLENILAPYEKTGLSIAEDDKEAKRFWEDRKRLGAIAAHTNAFKLNEDIVLPMDSLAAFVRFVDQTNMEEKAFNQAKIIQDIVDYLDGAIPLADPQWLVKKVAHAKDLAWATKKKLVIASRDALEAGIYAKNYYDQVFQSLRGYTLVLENLEKIYQSAQSRLIVIATHMHAGDGNVHVNIPVFSNDREMMQRAAMTADKVMEKAKILKGVVSGEHGIGVTKFKHLDPSAIKAFEQYRDRMDPDRIMNPNKLSEPDIINKIFTPSFNLLELEARILKHGDLSHLALNIANCVRCGKCKPVCPMFFPDKNMFFHPRNKNLALGSLIEAMLYITQRTQSTGFKILKNLEQIADHCTICHRCFVKCPVNIDTGNISIEERNILKTMRFSHTPLSTRMTLAYLSEKRPLANRLVRPVLLGTGAFLQRNTARLLSPLARTDAFARTRGMQLLRTKIARPDAGTLRAVLPVTGKNQALVLEPLASPVSTVFYFPGCGSERLFSRISMAAIHLLLGQNHRIILPPPFLCCGYPFKVNAQTRQYQQIFLKNIIVFTQIRDMFHDLDFDACLVSCGTCMESLVQLDVQQIFDCAVTDISEYVLQHWNISAASHQSYLYHAPCHDSLKDAAPGLLEKQGIQVTPVPFCCSEAGTMALSRPDISHSMLIRKQTALTPVQKGEKKTILTNCPSCLQGLGRQPHLIPVHLAEELAMLMGKTQGQSTLKEKTASCEIVTF